MSPGLNKLRRIAFPCVFLNSCFLIILLQPKQTILTKKKLTKNQKKNTKMAKKLTLHFIFYVTLY